MDTTRTYLISLFSGDGPPPPEVDLTAVMADLEKVNDDTIFGGAWARNDDKTVAGLHRPGRLLREE